MTKPVRALVVDDHEEIVYYLRALLEGSGWVVESAGHGAEALARARQHPPDLIVSDLLMPVMDGYTLLRHCKADDRLKRIPFVVYTATYTQPEDEQLALALGAQAFIIKPAEPEVLLARLRETLSAGAPAPVALAHPPPGDDAAVLKQYAETLIRKLEEKTLQLQDANRALEDDIARRRETERALRSSESMLHMAGRLSRMGGWAVELPDFTVTFSDEVCAIHDLPAGSSPGVEEAITYYAPEFRDVVRRALDACVHEGTPFDLELQIITSKGRRVWVRGIGEAARDPEGRVVRVQGAFQDITDRRMNEDETRRLGDRLALTLEGMTDGFYMLDRDWCFTYLNPEAEGQLFRSRDQLIGRSLWQAFPEIAGTPFEREFRLAVAETRTVVFEEYYAPFDAWFSVRAHPSDQGLAVYFQNVTEQRRALERIREQAALIDQASDAIFVRDMDHRITFWSHGAERVFGWTASEVAGQRVNALLNLKDDVFAAAERAVLETGEWHGEYEETAKNGALLALDGRWTLLRDEHGRPRSILTFDSDITERRKLELQFLRTQRMESIGTLAGGIAHDLNNVLSPILMSVGLLKDGECSPDRLSILDGIETSALRGADMVRQVLAFARGVEGRPTPTNLLTIVRDVQRIIRDTFPKNIELVIEGDDPLWTIDADATQLHQVLMNLCVNARDAMPHGGQLTIGVENLMLGSEAPTLGAELGPSVMLRVTDTGMGMSRAVQDRIFDPFFTTKEIGKGTGLGLSTVLTIVGNHHGHINVYSEQGRGTTFKIYLPARIEAPPGDTAVAEGPPLPRGHGEVVLVVDDEEGIRTLTRRILERFGYRVMLAANGAEAVAMYAQHRREIAVVLTDMAMPVMDGLATIVALRAMNPQVKIVGSSGHAANQGVAEALGAGVQHFIPKPYTAEAMVRVLDQVLGRAGGPS